MKALSIQQPWAWLIVSGFKDIENREWFTKVRGEILIHAGKKFDKAGYQYVKSQFPHIPLPEPEKFQRGGLVGKCTISDCVAAHRSPWFFGSYGFVLENQAPIDFKPYKGQLGFFDVKEEVNHA